MQPWREGSAGGPVELDTGHVVVDRPGRRHPTALFAGLAVAGLLGLVLVLVGSGLRCVGPSCRSGPWWVGLVLCAGLTVVGLLGWARRPPADRRVGWSPASAWLEVLVAGGAVLVLVPVLSGPQLHLLYRSGLLFSAAVLLCGFVAWWVAAALHGWLGAGPRRHEAVIGIVAGLAAATAWADLSITGSGLTELLPGVPVLWAAALAAAVVAVRESGGLSRVAAMVSVVLSVAALVVATLLVNFLVPVYLPQVPLPTETPAPVEEVAPGAAEELAPVTPADQGPGVPIGQLCHPTELDPVIGTPVPGGHIVATTLTVTNSGDRECEIGGWPTVSLLSGGEDLALFVHVANVDPGSGDHVEEEPFALAPGEAAHTQIWWRGHGAAADLQSDQELHVGVGGGLLRISVPAEQRWDLVHSAEAWVAPWQELHLQGE